MAAELSGGGPVARRDRNTWARARRRSARRGVGGGGGGGTAGDAGRLGEGCGRRRSAGRLRWEADLPERAVHDTNPPGVVTGLRGRRWAAPPYTRRSRACKAEGRKGGGGEGEGGGAARRRRRRYCEVTGQMGDDAREYQIAHTFAKSYLREIDGENDYLESTQLHIHVPEGATPKDGPSAGHDASLPRSRSAACRAPTWR